MRFKRLRLRNMGVFQGEHEFVFDQAGMLTALVGPNGAGKTTALGLLLGAIYRECPTRGSLQDLALARDSYVEVDVVHRGHEWTFRQLCDPISKRSEAVIIRDGVPAVETGKVRDADAFVAANFPPLDVVLTSVFSAQQAGGFLAAKPTERKALLLKILGVERLEALATRAREHQRAARGRLETLNARVADERLRGGDVAALAAELERARATSAERQAQAAAAAETLQSARAAAERLRVLREERERQVQALGRARQQVASLQAELPDLEVRIANNRAVLADGDKIRSATARLEELQREIAAARESEGRERAEERSARERAAAAARAADVAAAQVAAAEERVRRAEARLADREALERAAAELPAAVDARNAADRAHVAALEELERVQGARLAGAEERIGNLRGSLDLIRRDAGHATAKDLGGYAEQALSEDAEAVQAAAEQPERLRRAAEAAGTAAAELRSAQERVQRLETLAAGAAGLKAAQADLLAARGEIQTAHAVATRHRGEESVALQAAREHQQRADEHSRSLARLLSELQQVEPLAKRAVPLANAEARLAELEPLLDQKRAELRQAQDRCTELDPGELPAEAPVDLDGAARAAAAAETAAREAQAAVVLTEQRLADARASAERLAELEAEQRLVAAELSDWVRLADDLGKNGLQAITIDAAVPELIAITNSLLYEAFGTRFAIDLRTQTLNASGKKTLETLDVVVLDTERGREASAETFSGGERTILGEALSLGLLTLACRMSGIENPTVCRDESGAALDTEKSCQWVAMLRRAGELIGCHQIIFVSHDPQTWELADARIHIGAPSANTNSGEMPQAAE